MFFGFWNLITGFIVLCSFGNYGVYLVLSAPNKTIGEGQCIWYDTCASNPEKTKFKLNCLYEGEAKSLPGLVAHRLFKYTCPELAQEIIDEYGELKTCCSESQIKFIAAQLGTMGAIIKNCPACHSNMRKNFCYFVCHPRQSAFLNPTLLYEDPDEKTSVWAVTQYSSNTYVYDTYYSCENVYFPQINGPAMEFLCGPWGMEYCTPERLFDYFGNNYAAPFNITYVYSNENQSAPNIHDANITHAMYPFNVETFPCNTSEPSMQCRCIDCEESCSAPPMADEPPSYEMVGHIRQYVFIIILLYIAFIISLLLGFVVKRLPVKFKLKNSLCICNHKISAKFEEFFRLFFQSFGKTVASHPYFVLTIGSMVIIALSAGVTMLDMMTDPVELWASPESRTRKEKDYFDQNFGPFYRTNQIIITPIGIEPFNYSTYDFGPVFDSVFLTEVLDMQLQIMNLTAEYDGKPVTLKDVCIKPMFPVKEECLIQSVLNYWQNDPDEFLGMVYDDNGEESFEYLKHIMKCINNPSFMRTSESCLGSYGGPVFPYVALGGFLEDNETIADNPHYEHATALVLTFLGQNYVDKKALGPSLAWEKAFLSFMKNYSNPLMDIAYYSERSVEDEVIRVSKGDISTVLISYFVMFTYVAISLGNFDTRHGSFFIGTKISLGFCSVALVLLSVISSIGLCAYIGIKATLLVIEVIPFLVLAVGVDNIFLLVQASRREERLPGETIEDHIARIVGKVVPSMLVASCSEIVCFFLGMLSEMPAVYSFAANAGVALGIDFLFQITCLVALIVLDAKRQNENRYDVLCCAKQSRLKNKKNKKSKHDIFMSFFKTVYSPFLFKEAVRYLVLILFVGGFCTSCIFIPQMDIGLEQDVGMPDDSYVLKYFDFMAAYLSVGPPVYFVVRDGFNYPEIEEQNIICQSVGCNLDSVLAQIFWASEAPNVTYIATGATTWLDQYLQWLNDKGGLNVTTSCCRLDDEGNFINSSAAADNSAVDRCMKRRDFEEGTSRPLPEQFMEYLPYFLMDNPHQDKCPLAGHPAYGSAVVIKEVGCNSDFANNVNTTCVGANNYMAYHSLLKVSKEFTHALEKAYELTDNMNAYIRNYSSTPDVEIFPYSIFYVYYEQYLSMWTTVATNLAVSFVTVFLVMFVITGFDFRSTIINLIIIIMIVIDIMGLMIPWNIQLNSLSLVNLVMATGISVEFCSHITRTFSLSFHPTKIERASYSLVYTGSSVFSGITLTKFLGILILTFANSQVIIVYYFRMYMMIVLLGAAHGLIFLPVLLSFIGPPRNHSIKR